MKRLWFESTFSKYVNNKVIFTLGIDSGCEKIWSKTRLSQVALHVDLVSQLEMFTHQWADRIVPLL